jgi:hypothetical protein
MFLKTNFRPDNIFSTRQLLGEEFDLEIALRQRLAATIESRVTWALILQDILSDDIISAYALLLTLAPFTNY